MGIYLEIYAVELPRFDRLLDRTLADLLWLHQRTARATDHPNVLRWIEPNTRDHTFSSVQSRGVLASYYDGTGTRICRELTEAQAHKIPFLCQSARSFLNDGTVYGLKWLLEALTSCEGNDFVECLTEGYRRWWIGPALHHFREVLKADEADYQILEILFRKVLRGWNCGYSIPEEDVGVNFSGFPVVQESDPDVRIGLWSKEESMQAMEFAERLLRCDTPFFFPPGPRFSDPDDAECDDLVRLQLRCLARLRQLRYEHLQVVTFIG